MSTIVNIELDDGQMERLEREARRLGQSTADTAARLVEESLRASEFPQIEFRDSAAGRQAYLKGSRLTVWMVAYLSRAYDDHIADRTAERLGEDRSRIQVALAYADTFPAEIETAVAAMGRSPDALRELIPNLEVFTVDPSAR
jgi:hypothetical protein